MAQFQTHAKSSPHPRLSKIFTEHCRAPSLFVRRSSVFTNIKGSIAQPDCTISAALGPARRIPASSRAHGNQTLEGEERQWQRRRDSAGCDGSDELRPARQYDGGAWV